MPQVLIENPAGSVLILLVMIILGWGGRGFYLNFRKDKRESATHDADLLEAVRKVAREEVLAVADRAEKDRNYYDEQLHRERVRVARLEGRIDQLTTLLREAGIAIPAWKPFPPESEIVAMVLQGDSTPREDE